MANGVDPDQTAPSVLGPRCYSSVMLSIICSRRLQQTTFSDTFFLGAFRVSLVS